MKASASRKLAESQGRIEKWFIVRRKNGQWGQTQQNSHANNGTDREWKRFGGAVLFIGFPTAVGKWPEGPIGHSCESLTVSAM